MGFEGEMQKAMITYYRKDDLVSGMRFLTLAIFQPSYMEI
jgi:hypothetical protein